MFFRARPQPYELYGFVCLATLQKTIAPQKEGDCGRGTGLFTEFSLSISPSFMRGLKPTLLSCLDTQP